MHAKRCLKHFHCYFIVVMYTIDLVQHFLGQCNHAAMA